MRFKIGDFEIPEATGLSSIFGASRSSYPPMEKFPDEYRSGRAVGCKIFSDFFFNGGRLSDHGRQIMSGVPAGEFYATLRALMSSFEPPHELKEATCGLFIDTYTEETP